jgi:death-on-curing protein
VTYCFEPDFVIQLNGRLTEAEPVFLDGGRFRLESALARPLHTYDGAYLHGTLLERGAALLDGLSQAHAFKDGNKRTAWVCTLLYFDINQVTIADMPAQEAASFVESVVVHEYDVKTAAVWFADRLA